MSNESKSIRIPAGNHTVELADDRSGIVLRATDGRFVACVPWDDVRQLIRLQEAELEALVPPAGTEPPPPSDHG